MPNILEQQDLLKNLPDARITALLQNPVGDIPPFLVAAEANRRQTIRQQFAQNPGNESVVDTLTRQLAPQRMQAPAQITPPVPATPDMQGVAALQQQQQMMQAAQAAQQQMRMGGAVRRFAGAGFVAPVVGDRVQQIADQFGVTVEDAARMLQNNPSLAGDRPPEDFGKPLPITETNRESPATPLELNIPVLTTSPQEAAARNAEKFREAKYNEMDTYGGYTGKMPSSVAGMTPDQMRRRMEAIRRKAPDATNSPTPQPNTDETPDEYRARLEELYAAQEPSDWEKAQRWFDMSAQFLDPSKTNMESIVGAGKAFADASAETARAQRLAELEGKKALYEYDLGKADQARKTVLDERKIRTDIATSQLTEMRRDRATIMQQIAEIQKSVAKGEMTPEEAVVEIKNRKDQYDNIGRQLSAYEKYIGEQYSFPLIEDVNP